MAKFFIDRPIFAWVIALFIMVLGALSSSRSCPSAISPVGAALHRYQRVYLAPRRKRWRTACCP